MTIEAKDLMQFVGLAVSIGTALYAWIMSQGKAHEPKIKELGEALDVRVKEITTRLDRKADRLNALEGEVKRLSGEMLHLPDKGMVHRLELSLKDMQAQINGQGEVVKAVERTMQRVETFLLDNQGRPPRRSSK